MKDDTISRAAAIDALNVSMIFGRFNEKTVTFEALKKYTEGVRERIDALPSAQPPKEIPKRVLWTGWKGCRDTRYKCPNCEKPVRNDDTYCHRCGQRLMFPHISFTDYVPGEKQDVIVRWDDDG